MYTLCRYIQPKELVLHLIEKDCSILIKVTDKTRMYPITTFDHCCSNNHHCNYVKAIYSRH